MIQKQIIIIIIIITAFIIMHVTQTEGVEQLSTNTVTMMAVT